MDREAEREINIFSTISREMHNSMVVIVKTCPEYTSYSAANFSSFFFFLPRFKSFSELVEF